MSVTIDLIILINNVNSIIVKVLTTTVCMREGLDVLTVASP
jgi:hypothetical protein